MSDIRDVEITARTAWGEARGEGERGMLAVCWVIRNRAACAAAWLVAHPTREIHPLYGDGSPASAALRPWQFSCWNRDDPNRDKLLAEDMRDSVFGCAWRLAEKVLGGQSEDPTGGATHYHTVAAPYGTKTWPPRWTNGYEPTATIGRHVFYRLA